MQENIKRLFKGCFTHREEQALYESKDKLYMVRILKQQPIWDWWRAIHFENELESKQKDAIHELENYILVFYPGVLTWHEHRHLDRKWVEKQVISLIR